MIELSINEKQENLYNLAWKAEKLLDDKKINPSNDEIDLIYGITEGLIFDHWRKLMEGECSLNAFLNFDMEQMENTIDLYTKQITNIIQ